MQIKCQQVCIKFCDFWKLRAYLLKHQKLHDAWASKTSLSFSLICSFNSALISLLLVQDLHLITLLLGLVKLHYELKLIPNEREFQVKEDENKQRRFVQIA